jgi:hypothetical protein
MTFWIVLHHHKHGQDVFPIVSDHEPNETEAAKALKGKMDYEPTEPDCFEDGERLEFFGPYVSESLPVVKGTKARKSR